MIKQPARMGALALLMVAALLPLARATQDVQTLEQQKLQAQKSTQELRARIEQLEAELQKKNAKFRRASDRLRDSELAISHATRRLKELEQSMAETEASLKQLQVDIDAKAKQLELDRQALARQLRAQYSSNLSPWSALLAGEDPQTLGRELGYLSFVANARVQAIEHLRAGMAELSALNASQNEQKKLLQQQSSELEAEQQALKKQRQIRADLLVSLEGEIAAERAERDKLAQDEQQLNDLIDALGQQMEQLAADAQHASALRQEILEKLPQGEGLKRGIPMPIQGPIMARYGTSRPDGGDWRGMLIGAKAGATVQAVAAGTVVYATWLRGFGNLIIVDHGDQFVTVYGNNQSLLKQVGQTVTAGEAIAVAGNTGGQLDSALYFEIRHRGVPLDPQLYFKR
jgi:septal ring factor EnvC (AmiA/AmiB activator)